MRSAFSLGGRNQMEYTLRPLICSSFVHEGPLSDVGILHDPGRAF